MQTDTRAVQVDTHALSRLTRLGLVILLVTAALGFAWAYYLLPISRCCALPPVVDLRPDAAELESAVIHVVPWEIRTAVGLTIGAVRRADPAHTYVLSDRQSVAALHSALRSEPFPSDPEHLMPLSNAGVEGDFRVVVDIRRVDGTTESYAAEYGRLVDLQTRRWRPIDASFRRLFVSRAR